MAQSVTARIELVCSCGMAFDVPAKYASRMVECMGCFHTLRVPEAPPVAEAAAAGPSPDEEYISVRCQCGKSLRAPASKQGKRGRCPGCGHRIRLRGPLYSGEHPAIQEAAPVG